MNKKKDERWLDELIFRTIDSGKPEFDPEKWKQKYPEEFEMIKSLGRQDSVVSAGQPNIWRKIMKSRITKIAAAAVIIIAVLIGVHHFGDSIYVASVAWGEVVKKVGQAQTFVYRMKVNMTGMPGMPAGKTTELESVAYNSSEYGMRLDAYLQVPEMDKKIMQKMYVMPAEEALVMVIPEQKQYVRMKLTDELLSEMKKDSGDPKAMVRELMKGEYTELGRDVINGIEVECIESNNPGIGGGMFDNVVGCIWVDVETDLPVRMEMECSANDGSMQMEMVMDEFEWGVEFDATVFEPNIPADYKLAADVEMPEMNGEGVIKGLSIFSELTGGQYPSSLDLMTAMQEVGEVFRESLLSDPNWTPGKQPTSEQMQEMINVQMACVFYGQLVSEDKDPAYYGDKVTAEFGHAVLMRWKIDEGQYRVIFGDLTTEDVTAERLAELESMPLNINPYAIKPQPADGAARGEIPELSWMPGAYVTEHRLYFGTSADELLLLAEVTEPNFAELPALEREVTYYWRVDEVQPDGSIATGDVWSFNTGGMVAWWKLDDGSGDIAVDSSGNGYNGTLNNMDDSDWVDGALEFDGNDSFVSIPPLNLNSNTVTITAWIKRDGEQAESDTGIVFSRNGNTTAGLCLGHGEGWTVNHHLGYNWNNDGKAWDWDSGFFVPVNEWVFVALVVEPAKATLYLSDGTLSSAINEIDHRIEEFDGVTRIGHDVHTEGRYFKGTIDDVRIYNYALSQAEVEALYEGTLGISA
jgi:hypothetical protein